MRIRRKHKRLKDRACLPVFIVSAPILLIFGIAQLYHNSAAAVSSSGDPVIMSASSNLSSAHVIYETVESNEQGVQRFQALLQQDDGTKSGLSVAQWTDLLAHNDTDHKYAKNLTNLLKTSPYKGMRFETKGATSKSAATTAMEFAIVEDDGLYQFADENPDDKTFAEQLGCGDANTPGCVFPNLGNNAILVAPKKYPAAKLQAYGHLAAFVRSAPEEQITLFWQLVATTYHDLLKSRDPHKPVWLSTAGDGVAWLHVRMDDRPKYYHYKPFKTIPPS